MEVETTTLEAITPEELRALKKKGFSDRRLAKLLKTTEHVVRARRHALNIRPVYKRVDTCAAEFSTDTAYMYSCYEGNGEAFGVGDGECEAEPTNNKKIMVLGGGPNRIGQGIEFDYCCVHAALAMREDGYETIMVNCNPETVSTDYDTSDRLYFEPVTLEDVLEIVDKEKPTGVIVQYGGQTPLKLALDLEAAGVPIIGTSKNLVCVSPPMPQPVPSQRLWKKPLPWGTPWWFAPATCWVAGPWKSCMSNATWSATCAKRSRCHTTHRCCWTVS
ncbi:MAG: hypothetical protein RL707_937 [Pseudomonadota bacterium]